VTVVDRRVQDVGPAGGRGRLGILYAAVWLLFLQAPVVTGWHERDSVGGVVGILATVAFAVVYLVTFIASRRARWRGDPQPSDLRGLAVLAVLGALAAVVCLAVGQDGTATFVFLAVSAVLHLSRWPALVAVGVLAWLNEELGRTLQGWDRDSSLTLAVILAAFAMWSVLQVMLRNQALVQAHEENARLAVEDERNRFARDLHDILGHSLTVITVKAELAGRLLDTDIGRVRSELADLERLSRDALSDVRRAVGGYRELSLSGELVRAREALASAEIQATLPKSTEEVPGDLQELFAWTVREGVTNVIRHSGASRCTVSIAPGVVRVEDDGRGPADAPVTGHGLAGLRERAAAAGAVLLTSPAQPRGFRLEVTVP
jgi:two-component system, NarL family, sensor histidine kinase DesK